MNTQKVQELINKEIATLHSRIGGKAARKQYAPAKHQIAKLTELGIIDLMPKGFGHSDAGAIITAATAEWTAVFNAAGEGEEIAASDLSKAVKETEPQQAEPTNEATTGENLEAEYAVTTVPMSGTYDNGFNRQVERKMTYKQAASYCAEVVKNAQVKGEAIVTNDSPFTVWHLNFQALDWTSQAKVMIDTDMDSPEIRYIAAAIHRAYDEHHAARVEEETAAFYTDSGFRELMAVMTAAEVAQEFGLEESTVRQALNRKALAGRKSGGTWLVRRSDAEAKWGKK